MKTVFPNKMVAHVWAQQDQPEGRSNNGNLWFEGATLYSYRTPIARFVRSADDRQTVALISSEAFSSTTNGKHIPAAHRAVTGVCFNVPFLAEGYNTGRGAGALDHGKNQAYLADRFAKAVATAKRARDFSEYDQDRITRLHTEAWDYASVFGLDAPVFDPVTAIDEIVKHRALRDTPAKIKARERAKAKRDAKTAREAAIAYADYETRMAAWIAGEVDTLPRQIGVPSVFLRIKGKNLETSMGASVPLEHAVKVFRFLKLCRDRATEWKRNGHSLRVGHFTVDSVKADGSFVAGCHSITWDEVERVAKAGGLFDVTPADTTDAS